MENIIKVLSVIMTVLLVSCHSHSIDDITWKCEDPASATCRDPISSNDINVIVIVVDDLGYEDIEQYSSSGLKMNSLNRLASDGTLFTRGYVTASVCAPSRAGLMTGVYQQSFGFFNNITSRSRESYNISDLGLPNHQRTFASHLSNSGYKTGLIGKWHLGEEINTKHPFNFGFGYFFGILGGSTDYIQEPRKEIIGEAIGNRRNSDIGRLYENYDPYSCNEYLTDLLTRKAKSFISSACSDPFLLVLSYTSPHTPFQVNFNNVSEEDNSIYHGMIRNLDDNMSDLFDHLNEIDKYDNSLIFFISDNGCSKKADCNNTLLKGTKGTLYEGGVRVPFIVKWPKYFSSDQAQINSDIVSSLDIFPTINNVIGLNNLDELDGIVLPVSNSNVDGERILYFNKSIIKGNWKFVYPSELYDLSTDLGENTNVFETNQSKSQELADQLRIWKEDLPKPLW